MPFQIVPLTHDLSEPLLYFFDHVAFADNPSWGHCYCQFYHFGGTDEQWMARTGQENRQLALRNLQDCKMNGFTALVEGAVVGWCNASQKSHYARLLRDREFWIGEDDGVFSVVCFLIAPAYRRQGLTKHFLRAACAFATKAGCQYVEAYPDLNAKTNAQHYRGPLSLFESEGFSVAKILGDICIVRKKIGGNL